MLKEKGRKLDAVIELKVDEGILLKRIEKRIAETMGRGETLRADDNPDVLKRRLQAYRDQTAPLVAYYGLQSVLRPIDGMAPISEVAAAIDQVLQEASADAPPAKKPPLAKAAVEKSTIKSAPVTRRTKKSSAKAVAKSSRKPLKSKTKRSSKVASRTAANRKSPPRKSRRQQRLTKRR